MTISIGLIFMVMTLSSCMQEMGVVGRLLPNGAIDGKPVSRPIPKNTVAQTERAKSAGTNTVQAPLTVAMLERGQERYDIYCALCHGLGGFGNGVIVERGFSSPPSFHQERLRMASTHYLSNVIINGFGAMYGYADLLSEQDSLAIVHYIRALQLSQHVQLEKLPSGLREKILRELR